MWYEEFMEYWERFLCDYLPGIITSLLLLPITSDVLRERIWRRRERAIGSAKAELLSLLKGMFYSGQRITDSTFQKAAESISKKYHIETNTLGTKDDGITYLLQTVNTADGIPHEIRKKLSEKLQKEYTFPEPEYQNNTIEYENDSSYVDEHTIQILERHQSYTSFVHESNSYFDPRSDCILFLISFIISISTGFSVVLLTNVLQTSTLVEATIGLLIFLLCTNILISVINNNIEKGIEFYRKLVYKIIVLMVLAVISIATLVFR